MIILILPREKLLNFGHEKLRKVMEKVLESHGILKVSKSTNPALSEHVEQVKYELCHNLNFRISFLCQETTYAVVYALMMY